MTIDRYLINDKSSQQLLPVQPREDILQRTALHQLLWSEVQQLACWLSLPQLLEHSISLSRGLL